MYPGNSRIYHKVLKTLRGGSRSDCYSHYSIVCMYHHSTIEQCINKVLIQIGKNTYGNWFHVGANVMNWKCIYDGLKCFYNRKGTFEDEPHSCQPSSHITSVDRCWHNDRQSATVSENDISGIKD